jgi:hypothetical protein
VELQCLGWLQLTLSTMVDLANSLVWRHLQQPSLYGTNGHFLPVLALFHTGGCKSVAFYLHEVVSTS